MGSSRTPSEKTIAATTSIIPVPCTPTGKPTSPSVTIMRMRGPTSPGHYPLNLPAACIHNLVAFLSELAGTFLFLFFAFTGAAVAVNHEDPTTPLITLIFIAMSFGLSLTANIWAFYRISGGMFNPAVTLALWLVGGLPTLRAGMVVVAQLLGGIAAAGVVGGLFPGEMNVNTSLGGGTSAVQGCFIEMFLTAELVFVILMVAAEKHKATFMAPVAIGGAFFLTQLIGVHFTGGSLNPARSLGPAVVLGRWPEYFWIYFIGPILGALLASGFYSLLNFLRWKECNPGQDGDIDVEKVQLLENEVIQRKGSDSASF